MATNLRKQSGFTLVEVTIILLVLVILSTIMLPQLGNFNRLARYVKAREDVGALCSVIKKMLDETFQGAFYKNPRANTEPIGLLYGPGRIPDQGAVADFGRGNGNWPKSDCGWDQYRQGSGDNGDDYYTGAAGTCSETTDGPNAVVQAFFAERLENHLMQNNPDPANPNITYPNPVDDPVEHSHGSTGVGGYFGWRGPYVDWLSADPWGNRYAVNSFALFSPLAPQYASNADIYSSAVVVHTAGANERVDTWFNQPMAGPKTDPEGWHFGVDDIGCILSAGGPF